ncbi:MAG: hypothetical protein COY75_10435, partial [Nitrospirae bacterium CG_4_10_14_0_8_um_filter_41_23]
MVSFPEISNLIIELLKKEKDNNTRLVYIGILGKAGQPIAKEELRNIILSDNLEEAQAAVLSLGESADIDAARQIVNMIDDPREEMRQAALVALRNKIGDNSVIFYKVTQRLDDVSPKVSFVAAIVLSGQI